ncbi:hypothetical protein SPW_2555 [Streptomyces sp. W007]|nr:hypothetical protein SPW_2555 [Streptomyces sp. W007]
MVADFAAIGAMLAVDAAGIVVVEVEPASRRDQPGEHFAATVLPRKRFGDDAPESNAGHPSKPKGTGASADTQVGAVLFVRKEPSL